MSTRERRERRVSIRARIKRAARQFFIPFFPFATRLIPIPRASIFRAFAVPSARYLFSSPAPACRLHVDVSAKLQGSSGNRPVATMQLARELFSHPGFPRQRHRKPRTCGPLRGGDARHRAEKYFSRPAYVRTRGFALLVTHKSDL